MSDSNFIRGLESGDLTLLRTVPKTDLHNHACLGYPLSCLERHLGRPVAKPPAYFDTFDQFIKYLKDHLHAHVYTRPGFEFSIREALRTASDDGVTILEMSIDAQMTAVYGDPALLCAFLEEVKREFPGVNFRPEIGINREWDNDQVEALVMPLLEMECFRSIDLYGHSKYGPPEQFIRVYRLAAERGLRRKAHAGEYLDADFVRRSVEVLDLQEVQHGIRAAESVEVMNWLVNRRTVLNVCPTSNIFLRRVKDLKDHPIKMLYEEGVALTINSDDIMVFGPTVSEEYLNLYRAGVLTTAQLDEIRRFGLQSRT